ncbi:hypothetical protein AAG570_004244 [Ranatra chinensis]|uniref:Groucho/TLE N-terminal Q-rich domain-containing protein n=1 Tax=Ranatra chinensis TaxID=642074 RepID=A0ABD0Y3A9_9HEMI
MVCWPGIDPQWIENKFFRNKLEFKKRSLALIAIFSGAVWVTEISKRLNAIIAQILPFLSQEHQQQVATAVERAKQVTMTELNAIIGLFDDVSRCCPRTAGSDGRLETLCMIIK